MFRKMRRFKQQLPEEESIAILKEATSGVLAVLGDDGYPYTVPMGYFYEDGKLYFHCATSGHKLDAIKNCEKASFCVIAQDRIVPEEFTTYYKSVVVFGRIRIMDDAAKIREMIEKLADRYSPNESVEKRNAEIDREWKILCMLEFTIEHMTGKESMELTRTRK